MKPLYKNFSTRKLRALLTFNLVSVLSGVTGDMLASDLDKLKVRLVRPNITGALLLTAEDNGGNYVETDATDVLVHLSIPTGRSRVTIVAEYGTNVRTLAIVDIDTNGTESGVFEPDGIEIAVVKQLGGGVSEEQFDGLESRVSAAELELAGKADGSIYRVGESGDPAVTDVAKVYGHSVELSSRATATGLYAVAEGNGCTASGKNSHAEGSGCTASGENSHAEGQECTASGGYSHAEGLNSIAASRSQHVCGENNIKDAGASIYDRGEFAFIIGNGATNNARSNAFAIKWDGTIVVWNNGTRVELTPAKLATLVS